MSIKLFMVVCILINACVYAMETGKKEYPQLEYFKTLLHTSVENALVNFVQHECNKPQAMACFVNFLQKCCNKGGDAPLDSATCNLMTKYHLVAEGSQEVNGDIRAAVQLALAKKNNFLKDKVEVRNGIRSNPIAFHSSSSEEED